MDNENQTPTSGIELFFELIMNIIASCCVCVVVGIGFTLLYYQLFLKPHELGNNVKDCNTGGMAPLILVFVPFVLVSPIVGIGWWFSGTLKQHVIQTSQANQQHDDQQMS